MSDETTLLPCPFCGGEARLVNDYSSEKGMSYQIWHECTGHEGRSSGYGQGVKPFFETPWYATDAEAIAAWNTRAYLNPDGLPIGLTISDDGNLLNWRGENYVKQSTLTGDDVLNAVYNHGARWQAIADELNAKLGSDDEYEAKMDALLCRLTNGKWSKSRAYSIEFMVSCVDEEYEDAYEEERAELGSGTCHLHYGEDDDGYDGWYCDECGGWFQAVRRDGHLVEPKHCQECGGKVER